MLMFIKIYAGTDSRAKRGIWIWNLSTTITITITITTPKSREKHFFLARAGRP